MADVSIIVSSNAREVSKDIKGLAGSIVSTASKVQQMDAAFAAVDNAFNKGRISQEQYTSATNSLDTAQDKLYASLGKTSDEAEKQALAAQKAATAAKKLAQENEMLKGKYRAGYAASKQLVVATRELDTALKRGIISARRHKAEVKLLGQQYQRTGKNSVQFAAAQRMAGKSTNKFGMYTQQVGYQVGDFFVQVQSGTDALVAFGQQGTQLAGLLPGLAGAVLGIGLAIGTALGRAYLESKGLTINFRAVKKSFGEALEPMRPLIDAVGSAFSKLADTVKSVGSVIARNMARVISYGIAFAAIIGIKLVAAFLLSGKAATAFFRLIKVGLISTGIGILVVALGEILYRLNLMIEKAGGVALAFLAIKDVFLSLWEYGTASIDVYVARLKTIGPAIRLFIYGTINSMIYAMEESLRKFVKMVNQVLSKFRLPTFKGEINLGGDLAREKMRQAENDLKIMEAQVESLKGNADVALEGLLTSIRTVLDLAKDAGTGGLGTDGWLTGDTDKAKESELFQLKEEQRQRDVLSKMYGREYELKKQIFEITDQLGDEADAVGKKQIIALAKVNMKLAEQERLQKRNKDIADKVGSAFETSFMSIIDGTQSVKDAFKSMAVDIIKHLYKVLVVQQMVRSFGGFLGGMGGGLGTIGDALSTFGGGAANGGPVQNGRSYLVGERGPEIFTPGMGGGQITSNGNSDLGSGVTIVQNINISTGVQQTVRAEIRQMMPQIANSAKAAVVDAKRRGGSYGKAFA